MNAAHPRVPAPELGQGKRIGVLTSGGDAPGMNAAVRAVVRTALTFGAQAYAIFEGYQGMIDGGEGIRRFDWEDVGSILNLGGTVIGTCRSQEFKQRDGRLVAARNLLEHEIDRLVVIGGDGSLSGLDQFSREWPGLLDDLVARGDLAPETAAAHPVLRFAGLVGSIDNDLVGTDMTIGADSALHRIVDAIDALASTAASHQRAFVVEVMGRQCGYLALMSAIAGGCDYVLIPELPPADGWEDRMCAALKRRRAAGRRDTLVVIAEGAIDRNGARITSDYVRQVLEERTGEDTRVTILGHVQRGGTPSAFDRWGPTWLGYEATLDVLTDQPDELPSGTVRMAPPPSPTTQQNQAIGTVPSSDSTTQVSPAPGGPMLGLRGNQVIHVPLADVVRDTRRVPELIAAGHYDEAMALRGGSFAQAAGLFDELVEPPDDAHRRAASGRRIGIVHCGGLAPGMNAAARVAVRLGIARGFTMMGIHDGFAGLREGRVEELNWKDVEGWLCGGAELGVRRAVPEIEDLYQISRTLEEHHIDALLMAGGWNGYQAIFRLSGEQARYPAFRIPMVCVPASIDNNLPGSQLSIGADTALNVIVEAIDRIKKSSTAAKRAYVVETMGRYCGYLALMSGLAGGAERVYLPEQGISLAALQSDVEWLRRSFAGDRKLFLAVRNENANPLYTTDFLARLLEQESRGVYDVRQGVLGHIQQGGDPSPFDRLLATRLVARALDVLAGQLAAGTHEAGYVGLVGSESPWTTIDHLAAETDPVARRPKDQWWLVLLPVLQAVSDAAR